MLKFLNALKERTDWKTLLFHSSWSLTLTSGMSYFFGLLRDRTFAQHFGLSRTLDIYNSAFVIPDLLQSLFIGAALSGAFVPIFSELYDKNKSSGHQYARQIMTWGVSLIAVLGLFVFITLPFFASWLVPGFEGEELKNYILLTRIMLLSPILLAVSTTCGQVLISVKEFFWWGLSPALYNIGIIFGVLVLYPQYGIMGLTFGTLLGSLLHMINRLLPLRRKKYKFRPKVDYSYNPEIKETIKLAIPKMLQYGMWHFMLLNFTRIASTLPEGSVAVYGYARNFQAMPVSLLGIAIAMAMYPTLSHDAGKGNYAKFIQDFKKNRTKCLFYTTLIALGMGVFSKPLIRFLLGGGALGTAEIHLLSQVLMIYCISVPLESLLHIYHRSFYSLKNTLVPSTTHFLSIFLITVLSIYLKDTIGIFAIPVSFAIGMTVHIGVLAIAFPLVFKKRSVGLM